MDDARQGIQDLGVDVLNLEVVGRHHHFQSFRLRIKKADFEKIKNPDAWPDGIVVRRFFRGKRENNNDKNNNNNNNNNLSPDGSAISSRA